MRFEDERYVRVYTRDTTTWKLLPWNARCVLQALFRKVDRAGILELDGDPVESVAAVIEAPVDVVADGLPSLVQRGCVELRSEALVIPRFLEAQECKQSDPARKRAQRERDRAFALGETASRHVTVGHAKGPTVTHRDEKSHAVTRGHTRSHAVTPYCAVPTRTVPSLAVPEAIPEESKSGLMRATTPTVTEPEPDTVTADLEATLEAPQLSNDERYARAYAAGIERGKGDPYLWPGGPHVQGELNLTLPAFAKGPNGKALRGAAVIAWITDNAAAFAAHAKSNGPHFWAAYGPKGFQRWLNTGRPGAPASAVAALRSVPDDPDDPPATPEQLAALRGALAAATRKVTPRAVQELLSDDDLDLELPGMAAQ